MRWMMIGVVLGLALPKTAQPQVNSKQRKRDAFSELNAKRKTQQGSDAGLALRFFDALTGDPLVGAKVSAGGESTRTNGEGRALLKWPSDLNDREDDRTVRVSKRGYVTSDVEVHFMAGTIFNNRFSISPALPLSGSVSCSIGARSRLIWARIYSSTSAVRSGTISATGTRPHGAAKLNSTATIETALVPRPSPFERSTLRRSIPM